MSIRSLGLVVALLACGATARADFLAGLTASVTLESDGYYLYEYTLQVDAASDRPADQFDLAVDEAADLRDVLAPAGWGIDYAPGAAAVSFFAELRDAPIAPGSSGVFSFRSLLGPADQDYFLVGTGNPAPAVLAGAIASPSSVAAVPEPSTAALLATSLAIAGATGLARRRPRRA